MPEPSDVEKKKPYATPIFTRLGSVKDLTRGANGSFLDGTCFKNQVPESNACAGG